MPCFHYKLCLLWKHVNYGNKNHQTQTQKNSNAAKNDSNPLYNYRILQIVSEKKKTAHNIHHFNFLAENPQSE